MKITVKLLANYREHFPKGTDGNQISLDVGRDTLPEMILDMFSLPPVHDSVILVNGKSPNFSEALLEVDEVCIFSAMAGGNT